MDQEEGVSQPMSFEDPKGPSLGPEPEEEVEKVMEGVRWRRFW